ncbi:MULTISPECIES: hypothetical protein [Aphanizomenonaceae]|uniref:hypothetical protein n=1 Tax=Aphanizomenonaceae TaxID=1892259 RepID=UPI0004B63D64|nr:MULTISPECIES: hypothetical protein [Aphanizomenonaceae]MBE9258542.1 hypothetical protein [Dolichospermum sp. LEGE 00246]MDK2459636.1 hypothetical protein [Aphanizomenon sp. PH219]
MNDLPRIIERIPNFFGRGAETPRQVEKVEKEKFKTPQGSLVETFHETSLQRFSEDI